MSAYPVGTIARIELRWAGGGREWPLVERVADGWQSGGHHYPDGEVFDIEVVRTPPSKRVLDAKRRLYAGLIAAADVLDVPFTDRPELSKWKLLKRDMEALNDALGEAVVRDFGKDGAQ